MDVAERIRDGVEKVCSLYPAERERIERTTAIALEMDHPLVYRAFERSLRMVLEAREPSAARRRIDGLERACALVTSPGPGLVRKLDFDSQRAMRKAAAFFAVVALVAFAAGVVATLLE